MGDESMNSNTNNYLSVKYARALIAFGFLALLLPAFAAPPPQVVVNRMDSNGDNRISSDEWRKSPAQFEKIDANSDGYVTATEIQAFRQGGGNSAYGGAAGQVKHDGASSAGVPQNNKNKNGLTWIDVHFHIVADRDDLEGFDKGADAAIDVMDMAGIEKALVMPPPRPRRNYDIESFSHIAKKHASRIYVMGGGGTLNPMIQAAGHSNEVSDETKTEFRTMAEKIAASGVKGFGEIAAHHVSLTPTHGYESVPADHPLFLILADVAAKYNIPIDLHFDPIPKDVKTPSALNSPKNPKVLKENIKAFERLLEYNRDTKIVWAHAGSDPVGWYKPKLVRKMLDKHPNLYCSIRTVNRPDNDPVWHPKTGINYSWVRLFKKYPDRFVLGTDSFVVSQNYSGNPRAPLVLAQRTAIQREGANQLLSALKKDIAVMIARDNAIRIYNLND
jgi:hypothetical protein